VCDSGCGIGLKIVSPRGATYDFALRLREKRTNNQTEYEAICKGLELLLDAGTEAVEVFGDCKVVINNLTEEYNCASDLLYPYFVKCQNLMSMFCFITLYWIPREQNAEANKAAQLASGYTVDENSTMEVLCNATADWTADLSMRLTQPITLDKRVLVSTIPNKLQLLNIMPSLREESPRSTGDTRKPLYIAPLAM
jgi:ribonuclease HI